VQVPPFGNNIIERVMRDFVLYMEEPDLRMSGFPAFFIAFYRFANREFHSIAPTRPDVTSDDISQRNRIIPFDREFKGPPASTGVEGKDSKARTRVCSRGLRVSSERD